MKTDFEKGMELRKMIKTYIPYNISHKVFSLKDNINIDDIRSEWISIYISDEYISFIINDGKEYIKSEYTITDLGIDLKTLKKGNFKDMKFPDFDYLYNFIENILKNNKKEIEENCSGNKKQLKKQIEELNRQLKFLEDNNL